MDVINGLISWFDSPVIDEQKLKAEVNKLVFNQDRSAVKSANNAKAKEIYEFLISGKCTKDIRAEMCLVATLFRNSDVIDQDLQKAFDLFKAAADLGDVNAMLSVADMYEQGHGVEKDDRQAAVYLERAVESNELSGAELYEIGLKHYEMAQEFQTKTIWKPTNYAAFKKALDIFKKAADQNHSEANFKLWECYQLLTYYSDYGTQLDGKAWISLKKAVESKVPKAILEFGLMHVNLAVDREFYLEFLKISTDLSAEGLFERAYERLTQATELGVSGAASLLFSHRKYFQKWITPEAAKLRLEQAADKCLPYDLFYLGKVHQDQVKSWGIFKYDLAKAVDYYREAVKQANQFGSPWESVFNAPWGDGIEEKVLTNLESLLSAKGSQITRQIKDKLNVLLREIKQNKENRQEPDARIERVNKLTTKLAEVEVNKKEKTSTSVATQYENL